MIGIVTVQSNGNINFKPNDLKLFKQITSDTNAYNLLVVGSNTFRTLPANFDTTKRKILVVDRNTVEIDRKDADKVFIIGGLKVYEKWLPLCDEIYVGHDNNSIISEENTNLYLTLPSGFIPGPIIAEREGYRMIKYIKNHPERDYLNLLQKILTKGEIRMNERTGINTISLFGEYLKINLSDNYYPILHTRKMNPMLIQKEFDWYLSGSTDVEELKKLTKRNNTVWDSNTTLEFIKKQNLSVELEQGDLGASYGFQFRHFGANYVNCKTDYTGKGIDQVASLIERIKTDPQGRRHIISLWNVADLDKMSLPPCLRDYQFYVRQGKYLDCKADQRSSDFFLAGFWNIHQVAYFVYYICEQTGLKPGIITMNYGDIHIYSNQVDQCKEQIKLGSCELPYYQCDSKFNLIGNYNPISKLTAKMAV